MSNSLPNNQKISKIKNAVVPLLRQRVIISFLFNSWVKEAKIGSKDIGSIAINNSTKFSKKSFIIVISS